MNFSKTTEYNLRILSYMALNVDTLYTTNELHEILKIPFRYLRKQMNEMLKKGFLISTQGKTGGYKIASELDKITLFDIVISYENEAFNNKCFFGFKECPLNNRCSMHDKWLKIRQNTIELLKTTTLQDIKTKNNSIHLIS